MIKNLFTAIISILAATTMWAQDEIVDFTLQNLTNAESVASIEGTGCTVGFTNAKWYDNGSAIRVYNGGSMTVTSTNNAAIESITLTLMEEVLDMAQSPAAKNDTTHFWYDDVQFKIDRCDGKCYL